MPKELAKADGYGDELDTNMNKKLPSTRRLNAAMEISRASSRIKRYTNRKFRNQLVNSPHGDVKFPMFLVEKTPEYTMSKFARTTY